MEKGEYKATIYDDVWRTIVHDFPNLLIAFVNELFAENYSKEARVEFLQDTHEQKMPDGTVEKRITDTYFRIVNKDGTTKKYHLECQSTADSSMLVRLFEYGACIALDDVIQENDRIVLEFPHAAVLFLRSNRNTPDFMHIELKTPGGSVNYKIPVAKMQSYTIDAMLNKQLLILLPFYLFVVEKSLKDCEENSDKLAELLDSLQTIVKGLDALLLLGYIDELTRKSILEFSNMVNVHLARNYAKVRKGAEDVMGGKILEYEAKTIHNNGLRIGLEQGREQGLEQGLEQGRAEKENSMIISMLKNKLSLEQIVSITGLTMDKIVSIGKQAAVL